MNLDAGLLTPVWPLTPLKSQCGIWRPNTPKWHLTPQYPWVAFDASIPPGGIWRPNTPGWHLTPQYPRWHLTPQYPRVAFDAPIISSGIWRPEQFFRIFQFFSKFLDSHFKDPFSGLDQFEALEALQSPLKPSLDPRTLGPKVGPKVSSCQHRPSKLSKFDAPIPLCGIWCPNNPWVAFDARNNFSEFFFKIFWIPFLDPHLGFHLFWKLFYKVYSVKI